MRQLVILDFLALANKIESETGHWLVNYPLSFVNALIETCINL